MSAIAAIDPLSQPLELARGSRWPNRLVLAPLTNQQSHDDGTLSDAELRWLTMRAAGGFAVTMTCASHVQASGKGFPGQLGVFDDVHIEGLTRLSAAIRVAGSVPAIQLYHGGFRALADRVGPVADAESGSSALSTREVEQVRDDFIAAAVRAERAGFAAAEVHGAHGYLLAQFLSAKINRREDCYGGSAENRARLITEILAGIRAACGPAFQLGLRLSPERFGQSLPEIRDLAGEVMAGGAVDFLDMSLWDAFKQPEDAAFGGRTLLECFTDLPRGQARLGAAGGLGSRTAAERALALGCDFVVIGKPAIVTHDLPARMIADRDWLPPALPVTADHLAREGASAGFIAYLHRFPDLLSPG